MCEAVAKHQVFAVLHISDLLPFSSPPTAGMSPVCIMIDLSVSLTMLLSSHKKTTKVFTFLTARLDSLASVIC